MLQNKYLCKEKLVFKGNTASIILLNTASIILFCKIFVYDTNIIHDISKIKYFYRLF